MQPTITGSTTQALTKLVDNDSVLLAVRQIVRQSVDHLPGKQAVGQAVEGRIAMPTVPAKGTQSPQAMPCARRVGSRRSERSTMKINREVASRTRQGKLNPRSKTAGPIGGVAACAHHQGQPWCACAQRSAAM